MQILLVANEAPTSSVSLYDDRDFVTHADTHDEALSILRHTQFDLIVLDMAAEPASGLSFIRRLRAARQDVPLVALTGRQAEDRVSAIRLGADDAVSQPVDLAEVRARIRAVVRRHKGHSQPLVQLGALSLSLETREVWFRTLPVRVTPKEYALLEILILRQGTVVTKEMLLAHLYGGFDEPEVKIIDVFICKLRRRLADVGAADVIATVWGQGYAIRSLGENKPKPPARGQEERFSSAASSSTQSKSQPDFAF